MAARRSKKADPAPAAASPAPAPEPAPTDAPPASLYVRPTRVGTPCDPARAEPLRVVAHLSGPVVSVPMLDSMLAALVALIERLPAVIVGEPYAEVDIPIQREPGGRFHLCSAPIYREERYETRHRNRRFPILEAQMLAGPSLKRVNVQNGPTKSFRIPYQQAHLLDDRVLWYALGDRARFEEMLGLIDYLGKQRGVGKGRVVRWQVERVEEPWPGFPVVLDGTPLRPLPLDWPGVTRATRRLTPLSYPYHDQTRRAPCLVGENF